MPAPINLLDGLPQRLPEELVTVLLAQSGLRIERIVSTGQTTPVDAPYDQDHDEWVLLLSGSAALWIEGEGEYRLRPGDAVLIKARQRHRVTHTAPDQPTVWLAIHLPPEAVRG
jgi:cupin 2 domain-containing protein